MIIFPLPAKAWCCVIGWLYLHVALGKVTDDDAVHDGQPAQGGVGETTNPVAGDDFLTITDTGAWVEQRREVKLYAGKLRGPHAIMEAVVNWEKMQLEVTKGFYHALEDIRDDPRTPPLHQVLRAMWTQHARLRGEWLWAVSTQETDPEHPLAGRQLADMSSGIRDALDSHYGRNFFVRPAEDETDAAAKTLWRDFVVGTKFYEESQALAESVGKTCAMLMREFFHRPDLGNYERFTIYFKNRKKLPDGLPGHETPSSSDDGSDGPPSPDTSRPTSSETESDKASTDGGSDGPRQRKRPVEMTRRNPDNV